MPGTYLPEHVIDAYAAAFPQMEFFDKPTYFVREWGGTPSRPDYCVVTVTAATHRATSEWYGPFDTHAEATAEAERLRRL